MAALAAAVAGAVFGRMSGLNPWFIGAGWTKLGSLDFKEEPHWYFGVASFLPLLVLCGVLRLTLFNDFPAPRRQRAVIFPMMVGPSLAIAASVAFVLTAMGLGFPDLFKHLVDITHSPFAFVVATAFVQGVIVGVVAGAWFAASPTPAAGSSRRVGNFLLAVVGAFTVLSSVASVVGAWIKGKDRSACILNCRNVQQAMRSFCGMNGHNPGDVVPGFGASSLVGPGLYPDSMPVCPAGGRYTWVEGRFPLVGELMIRCSCPEHVPPDHGDW